MTHHILHYKAKLDYNKYLIAAQPGTVAEYILFIYLFNTFYLFIYLFVKT